MKSLTLLLSLFVLAYPCFANDGPHPATLWEVKGEQNSVYLLGSIHLLRRQDYPLPSIIDTAFDDAEVLIMEVDMDDMDPFAAQAAFTKYGLHAEKTTLQSMMGAEQYSEALAAAENVDIPLQMMGSTEPWYAAMMVEVMLLSRVGFDPNLGIEMHMLQRAKLANKPIEGFETIEEQVQFLDGMSLPAQRAMLLSTLTEGAQLQESMDELIHAWHHGNVEFLEQGLLDEFARHEELNKVLIEDRNARWVKSIEPLLADSDDYLIVVGALHLVGPQGVPRLLQKNGYRVQQLSEPPTLR